MKKFFFTGLITLLPFTLTITIVAFIINFFTTPFQGYVANVLDQNGLLDQPFLIFSAESVLYLSSKFLVLFFILLITILIGFLGHLLITKTFFRFGDYLIHRIPFINKVYKPIQDVITTLFGSKGSSFSQAVVVPFPYPGVYSMGFITQKQTPENHLETLMVFIPGTPNPTGGFILSFKYEEIIFLDFKVEDALKFIISCGIMYPGSNQTHKSDKPDP